MHYCVLCLFYLILILYNICATQQTNSMSSFLSMFCVFHLTMCVVPCPCPENKDFSTNCSNFFQSKMLFGFCNGHSREQRLRRSRREVELHCCPLPHLHGFYISATEAKKREAVHPVISKVGLWGQWLVYHAVLSLPSPAFTYQEEKERKRGAGHPVSSKVGWWRRFSNYLAVLPLLSPAFT